MNTTDKLATNKKKEKRKLGQLKLLVWCFHYLAHQFDMVSSWQAVKTRTCRATEVCGKDVDICRSTADLLVVTLTRSCAIGDIKWLSRVQNLCVAAHALGACLNGSIQILAMSTSSLASERVNAAKREIGEQGMGTKATKSEETRHCNNKHRKKNHPTDSFSGTFTRQT